MKSTNRQIYWYEQGMKDERYGSSSTVPKIYEKWYDKGVKDYQNKKIY